MAGQADDKALERTDSIIEGKRQRVLLDLTRIPVSAGSTVVISAPVGMRVYMIPEVDVDVRRREIEAQVCDARSRFNPSKTVDYIEGEGGPAMLQVLKKNTPYHVIGVLELVTGSDVRQAYIRVEAGGANKVDLGSAPQSDPCQEGWYNAELVVLDK